MEKNDAIKLLINYKIGLFKPFELKDIVNTLINDGLYLNGFDLAVKRDDLNHDEALGILNEIGKEFCIADTYVNNYAIILDDWNYCGEIYYEILNNDDLIVGDNTSFARYSKGKRIWKSNRVSIDGFSQVQIDSNRIRGKWFSPMDESNSSDPWHDFEINVTTGLVRNGCGWDDHHTYQKGPGFLNKIISFIKSLPNKLMHRSRLRQPGDL